MVMLLMVTVCAKRACISYSSITMCMSDVSGVLSSYARGVFHAFFYNHVRRLRIEKILYLEPSRSSSGYLNHFWIQVAVSEVKRPLGNRSRSEKVIFNGHSPTETSARSGVACSGYVTAVAAGQSQRFYFWYGNIFIIPVPLPGISQSRGLMCLIGRRRP
jgi:hypothetical protein